MKTLKTIFYLQTLLILSITSCAQNNNQQTKKTPNKMTIENNDTISTAVFGAGCFWCVEAVFQQVNGVVKIESGYSNGDVKNPTYREVCYGKTGHAEVCKIKL
jgi:peptide-methionine (S)-S-oxide reductase